jgi:hypothetical protein
MDELKAAKTQFEVEFTTARLTATKTEEQGVAFSRN